MNLDPTIYQLDNQPISQSNSQGSANFASNNHRWPKFKVPFVGQLVITLGALILMAGIITSRQLTNQSTLDNTLADAPKVDIYFKPSTSTLAFSQEKEIELRLNSGSEKLSGVEVVLTYDSSKISISDFDYSEGSFPVAVASPEEFSSEGEVLAALSSFDDVEGDILVMKMKVKAKSSSGTTNLTINPETYIAVQGVNTNTVNITNDSHATIKISDSGEEPPPNEPEEPDDPEEPDEPEKPEEPEEPDQPEEPEQPSDLSLSTQFVMQGVNKPGVSVPFSITFSYLRSANDGSRQDIRYEQVLTSGEEGLFSSEPITLPTLNLNDMANNQIDVYVKSPSSLRKKLGSFDISQSYPNNTLTIGSIQKLLLMGDFVHVGPNDESESNKINMLDISQMLGIYTQLETDVNDNNSKFDLDHNGVIDIFDISIVVSNYTDTVVKGD